MVRPLSEDKRVAILAAATRIVAVEGVAATTASVAKEAGVATGSLFTYYPSKDALLNGLYLALKQELADALLHGFPQSGTLQDQARHLWNRYIGWALAHPDKRLAMDQLSLSRRIAAETVAAANARLDPISELVAAFATQSIGLPLEFATSLMTVMAGATIEFAARQHDQADAYVEAGFDAFWRAIAKA